MTEFELIRTFFASPPLARADVAVPVGDDAAAVDVPAGMQAVLTTDVLVAGVHFFEDVDPAALGHKALAVNLSDLAAMGAEPAWFLLDLTLPRVDTAWLAAFAQGMYALARRHEVQLIGGDTSRGPLAIAVTAVGLVPRGAALRRAGARPGDGVYVTGTLGDAAFALAERTGTPRCTAAERALLDERLERPTPRVVEGLALRGVASSAIDVSDGLLADLGHVLAASGVGARLRLEAIPLSAVYRRHLHEIGWEAALAGGDDYELCFTVPAANEAALAALAAERGLAVTRIGEITAGEELAIYDETGRRYEPARRGHEHFR
ncbi:MAG TPA: thiamine-phosphate kinase [Burkholderiales bacterium]